MDKRLQQTESGWLYLGYPLRLGKAENAVLCALYACPGRGFHTTALSRCSGVGESTVSLAVKTINEKAMPIGGRPILLSGRREGYRIAEDL